MYRPAAGIDEFFAFMAALDPLVVQDRRGADPAAVERLQQLAGRPFPPLYREFLRELGERSLVPIGGDGWQTVTALLRYYDRRANAIPRDAVVICTPAIEPATLLVYREGAEPEVVEDGETVAPSFAHQLFRRGWLVALRPNRTGLTIAGGDAVAVARSAERAGFERLWFSGGATSCLDDGVTQLFVEQQGPVVRATVMSRRVEARARVADWLIRRHSARRP